MPEVGDRIRIDVAPATTDLARFDHIGVVLERWKTSSSAVQAIVDIVGVADELGLEVGPSSRLTGAVFLTAPHQGPAGSTFEAVGPADHNTKWLLARYKDDLSHLDYLNEMDRLNAAAS